MSDENEVYLLPKSSPIWLGLAFGLLLPLLLGLAAGTIYTKNTGGNDVAVYPLPAD
ncbi:hypothetical protein Ga0609869_000132 [Rhodovulum iodosum]|uniref:Uncharacterized protein n=1 Tax=Rhodovulum iodosum TaxID=68291 RepID=A0ABV3XN86_9RHOB|nr:hypothetical protein [Rhodovulum robiginosum]